MNHNLIPSHSALLNQKILPEVYMTELYLCHQSAIDGTNKTKTPMNDLNFKIPMNYEAMMKMSYNSNQLKHIAKYHKLKVGGTKTTLFIRISTFLWLSHYATKLQKVFRGKIERRYIKLHGPALKNRKLCTNDLDCVTLDELSELSFDQFYSFQDIDQFIYGFNLTSIYSLIKQKTIIKLRNPLSILNPYNRNEIPEKVFIDLDNLIRLSKILNKKIVLEFVEEVKFSDEQLIEHRALTLFQNIDALGNYSEHSWFMSLTKIKLCKLARELMDIWNYRAQITVEIKRTICPPHGDLFRNTLNSFILQDNFQTTRQLILELLDRLVTSGVDRDSKCLGAYYVLGALTLVSEDAAAALPWLYQSFVF